MKKYKLKKDLPTFKAGEEFLIGHDGGLWLIDGYDESDGYPLCIVKAYDRQTLGKFPNILTDWFEEIEEIEEDNEVWKPEKDDAYIRMDSEGYPVYCIWNDSTIDRARARIGNCFKTQEKFDRALAKLKAYQIVKADAKGFKPTKYDDIFYQVCADVYEKELIVDYWSPGVEGSKMALGPAFRAKGEAKHSIETHRKEWELLFDLDLEEK